MRTCFGILWLGGGLFIFLDGTEKLARTKWSSDEGISELAAASSCPPPSSLLCLFFCRFQEGLCLFLNAAVFSVTFQSNLLLVRVCGIP